MFVPYVIIRRATLKYTLRIIDGSIEPHFNRQAFVDGIYRPPAEALFSDIFFVKGTYYEKLQPGGTGYRRYSQ